jgi:acetoin utilization deacetylase AcuC-like enzyme
MPFFVAFHPRFSHDVPKTHRFPMEKYDLLYQQLLYEGMVNENNVLIPEKASLDDVLLVHTPDYVHKLLNLKCTPREQRVSGFEHNLALIEREFRIVEATRKCAEMACKGGIALNIAGGTHHAFTNRGEGFCLLNDQAVAAAWLLKNQLANRILIVDLDVHQGNGTAQIFHHETKVFTFSLHGKTNYPLEKEQSDLDVPLEDKTDDYTYLSLLANHFSQVVEQFNPDFMFYQCGVDVLGTDKMGKLNLSHAGVRERDLLVLNYAKLHGIPLVCSMGGGYSKDIRDIVNAHMNVFREGYNLFGEN